MSAYVITGVSRGIGYEFLNQLSSNPKNTVIGLVRNVSDTQAKVASLNRSNIHIIHGDLDDYASLKKAAETTSNLTNGAIDYLIANAAYLSTYRAHDRLSEIGSDPKELEELMLAYFKPNVISHIHLFNLFMPLILKGSAKKVIAISSGLADVDLAVKFGLYEAGPYSVSKAGLNVIVAKFQAEYKDAGVLFLALSPGAVGTGQYDELPEEELAKVMAMGAKFNAYAPHFTGHITPEESVQASLAVIEKVSLENGDGGAFISHKGNKEWL